MGLPEPQVLAGRSNVSRVLARLAHEQFPGQVDGLENLGRFRSLAVDHLPFVKSGPDDAGWTDALGVGIIDYWRIGWILHAAFVFNDGAVAWDTLALQHAEANIFAPLEWNQARAVIEGHFIQSVEEAMSAARENVNPESEKWAYNPLEGRPIIDTGSDLICPTPHFLFAQLTPTGLYYLGLKHFGRDFGQAMGDAFEAYVGVQLSQLEHVDVFGEIPFGKDSMSCDYLLVASECILLIECKSGRPDVGSRLGEEESALDKIKKAVAQLETTAQLIRDRNPSFRNIPNDRPLVGLIVTLEPHYVVETWSEDILWSPHIPIVDATALDLEIVIGPLAGRHDVGARIRDRIWPRPPLIGPPRLLSVLEGLEEPYPRNPVSQDAFDRLTDFPALLALPGVAASD